ncbi:unnamed protein product [Pleuronectes platessa]|uniref:Uncharacterized protein n=1 Tax=Pleuronectes platessa TaxID=8262 RepID=A0A9N7YIH1_PLEPL|nr:unnamed protein product [Pleuronectes platessa]
MGGGEWQEKQVSGTVLRGRGGLAQTLESVKPLQLRKTAFKTNLSDKDEPKLLKILKDVSLLWALLQEIGRTEGVHEAQEEGEDFSPQFHPDNARQLGGVGGEEDMCTEREQNNGEQRYAVTLMNGSSHRSH